MGVVRLKHVRHGEERALLRASRTMEAGFMVTNRLRPSFETREGALLRMTVEVVAAPLMPG